MKRIKACETKGAWVMLRVAVMALFLAVASPAAGKPYRVGIVLPNDEWTMTVDGFKEGMRELGYVERRDVQYLMENAKGNKERVAQITRKYLDEKVDLIFTVTNTALKTVVVETQAATLPVVFGSASGPVESGVIPAYASPDAHITGVNNGSLELGPKRLALLCEILPKARRIVAIGDGNADSSKLGFAIAAKAAAQLKLDWSERRVYSTTEAIEAGKRVTLRDADALFLIPGLYSVGAASSLADAALANRMPFAAYYAELVKKPGALFSYGTSYFLEGKQSAVLVDKILKGAPVSRLPIEKADSLKLIINLVTARKIGVQVSPVLLNRADDLIPADKE